MEKKKYGSERWKKKRNRILRRDKYIDKIEARYGRTVEATIVHHIFPADEYPEFFWTDWNLISVSRATHQKLHNKDGSLSDFGEELRRRTGEKNGLKR